MSGEFDYAAAIAHDCKRWRERALAAHPRDAEMLRAFHDGLARVVMEHLIETSDDPAGVWIAFGRNAFGALVETPETQTPEPSEEGPGAGASRLGKGATGRSKRNPRGKQ